jgi:hypothetical protein
VRSYRLSRGELAFMFITIMSHYQNKIPTPDAIEVILLIYHFGVIVLDLDADFAEQIVQTFMPNYVGRRHTSSSKGPRVL